MNRWYNGYEVAVKVLLKQFNKVEERYFIQEVLAGCTINHPNCLRYYGYSATPKDERGNIYPPKPIIVMERGKKSLREYMINKKVDLNQRIDIIKQIANGLLHIHNENLIHRDIKVY